MSVCRSTCAVIACLGTEHWGHGTGAGVGTGDCRKLHSEELHKLYGSEVVQGSVSQPPGRGPVPGPGINYTGPREVLLEFVILVF